MSFLFLLPFATFWYKCLFSQFAIFIYFKAITWRTHSLTSHVAREYIDKGILVPLMFLCLITTKTKKPHVSVVLE